MQDDVLPFAQSMCVPLIIGLLLMCLALWWHDKATRGRQQGQGSVQDRPNEWGGKGR